MLELKPCPNCGAKVAVSEEIIRCEDCKYSYRLSSDTFCNHPRTALPYEGTLEVMPDGFCAWAESRK